MVDNHIGDEGAKAIAEALKVNPTCNLVDMDANMIGDEGASALADALEASKSLNYLFLQFNQIGHVGLKAIHAAESERSPFTVLRLDKSPVAEEVLAESSIFAG